MAELESIPVLSNKSGRSSGFRVEYVHEDGVWWAYADMHFSAAGNGLASLKHRVHLAMVEMMGPDVEYTEVVHGG
jgi:hypothetical protein